MITSQTGPASAPAQRADDHFEDVAAMVLRRVAEFSGRPLFRTRHEGLPFGLFGLYLDGFAPWARQTHNCNACRRFIQTYGGLVALKEDGTATPALWSGDAMELPPEYADSVLHLAAAVKAAPIDGVFLSDDFTWGTYRTPDAKRGIAWDHFNCPNPTRFVPTTLRTAAQAMAEKREDFGMLQRALAEFPREVVQKAKGLLETDALYRSEKVLGVATWLLDLHDRRAATKNQRARENMVWLAVATAPPGFCHVRSTMVGTLLEDLAVGKPFEDVKRAFAAKMHPLQYARPQAPPSAGHVAAAEKVVEKLNAAGALARRFARLEDVRARAIWTPRPAAPPAKPAPSGVFGHLLPGQPPAGPAQLGAPPAVITWEKFSRTVLPSAERIECLIPSTRAGFLAFVTAANPDAPPLLQWDHPDERNPLSWYLYVHGSMASDWNLAAGTWATVNAITLSPAKWGAHPLAHHSDMAVLILEGARDLRHTAGGGFFPEQLRAEYHDIRRAMEAHAASARIAGRDEATACGLALQKGSESWSTILRVTSRGLQTLYRPDRWD